MKNFIVFILAVFLLFGCGKIKSLLNSEDEKPVQTEKTEKKETQTTETKQDNSQQKSTESDEIKKKELELKEKELELKEKEIEANKNKTDSRRTDNYDPNHRGERNYKGTPGSYPEGSLRYLTYNDVSGRSKWELSVMRNEIYARHGYIFTQNMEIKRYFEGKSWYYPSYYNVDGMLSKVEKWNINYIKSFE